MPCCLETAILDTLRGIQGTKITPANHFVSVKGCKDCSPYLVLGVSTGAGLRTSSAVQKVHSIEINAYFKEGSRSMAIAYRDLLEDWIFSRGCVDLGVCGCFCLRNDPISAITNAAGGMVVYRLSFRGIYVSAESVSDSASESV